MDAYGVTALFVQCSQERLNTFSEKKKSKRYIEREFALSDETVLTSLVSLQEFVGRGYRGEGF
jgi:hypothetical protein